ncbi:MAG: hypothetical protein ACYTE5_11600, partial [Planctomycetota bacterium]
FSSPFLILLTKFTFSISQWHSGLPIPFQGSYNTTSTHFTADVFSVDKPTMTYYVSNNPANGYKYIDTDISHYVSIQETSSASAHRFIHHHGYIAGDKYRESDLSY